MSNKNIQIKYTLLVCVRSNLKYKFKLVFFFLFIVGKKVDFHIDEINENDTVLYGKMSKLRYQSESMFTNLISSQMNFNEHFHSDLLLGHKEMEKTSKEHINLIELTCKYELGLRSFSSIDTDLYETVNTNGVNRFKK